MFVVSVAMDPYYKRYVTEFITNVTVLLPVDSGQTRIGVVTYWSEPRLDIGLGQLSQPSEITDALNRITYHDSR